MDIRNHKLPSMILARCFVVPILLGFSKSNDPVLTHMCCIKCLLNGRKGKFYNHVIQIHICAEIAAEYGAKFWRNFLECNQLLESEMLDVLSSCIPVSSQEEAERTRCSVCSKPDQWIKMMDCMNKRLIELQDESNPYQELSPSFTYKTCVKSLTEEAWRSFNEKKTFLPEDNRIVYSNCSET